MKHIILADDDPGIQDAASLIFERAGYRITVLSNGETLLDGDFEMPDLFILDKQLSGVDGLDVCRHLKNTAASKDIPVIMLSASPHIKNLAQMAGADAAMAKPFKMKELRALVQQYINMF